MGPFAAVMVDHIGWVDFYLISCVAGVPALLILFSLRRSAGILIQSD